MAEPVSKAPFVYRVSKEKLQEFKNWSAETKLRWLEEANRFVQTFVTPAKRIRWEKFRNR